MRAEVRRGVYDDCFLNLTQGGFMLFAECADKGGFYFPQEEK
jgi:hypothetical protein